MRTAVLAAVVAAGGALALAGEAAPDRVRRLVDRLGSDGFRDREAATRELDSLGETALAGLRAVAASADPEARRRAADLIERIGDRLATARILAPTPVEFDYRDRPLADAVADLARRTGASLTLHDPVPNKFRGRKVTAATPGPVPFWEAVELLCRKADLHEWDGLSPVPGFTAPQPATQLQGLGGFGGQVMIVNRSGRSRPAGPNPNATVLLDGPGTAVPASRGGAVRVRALPPGTPFPTAAVGSDEVVLPLQVSPEPKLNWQSAATVRIDRAVDESGRLLAATAAVPVVQTDADEMVFINGMFIQGQGRRAGPVGVRVRRGDKPAKRLAELSGTVAAQVRLAEPLAVVDAPLKAAGQAVRGSHGVSLAVKSISRGDSGDVTLSAEVKQPLDVQIPQLAGLNVNGAMFAGQIVIQGPGAIRIGGGGVGGPAPVGQTLPAGATEYQGLSVEDTKGRRFTATKGVIEMGQYGPDGATYRITATFRPAAKELEPGRLVFTATRPATIDIPFVVKDVPLP